MHARSLDALIHRGLFYELSRRNVSTADEMYCRAQEIDGKRAKDKYDQVNPKLTCFTSTKVQMLTPLVDAGNPHDLYMWTPLHKAAYKGAVSAADLLLEVLILLALLV